MYPINTRIYLSDLQSETKDQLIEAIISRLRDDEEKMKKIEKKVDDEIKEDGDVIDLEKLPRKNRIEMELEDTAQEILEDTFYGEINVGE